MRTVFFALICLFNILIAASLEIQFSKLPALGDFFNPNTGFWQNTKADFLSNQQNSITSNATVYLDDRQVPHIFAQSEKDLYFAQGYATAAMRLWQMDMQTIVAGGRLCEFLGFSERLETLDRYHRRTGLPFGAELAAESIATDSETFNQVQAYSAGVNKFISELTYKNTPIEYKLIGFKPEKWNALKTALLLKLMANDLTGREYDLEHHNALNRFGLLDFNTLYPEYLGNQVPIIPIGTYPKAENHATQEQNSMISQYIPLLPREQPETNKGSNNWAIAGNKSVSGKPILCDDPHLTMNLPSIWIEMHLIAPGINVYGVALTGSPGIVIGFNEDVAWGLTNASVDVRDWYNVTCSEDYQSYLLDSTWVPTTMRIEEMKNKDGKTWLDTIYFTAVGPIVYDRNFKSEKLNENLALRWTAHLPSNELKALSLINRAKNYDDYMNALDYFSCPGQNFVFADRNGDIAIRTQGKFPIRKGMEGKLLRDGTQSDQIWNDFIPLRETPHIKNPERGFVSSANQHPTDTVYPYHYSGIFQYFRNKRINEVLEGKAKFTVDDMKALQLDNKNIIAEQCLPVFLDIASTAQLSSAHNSFIQALTEWNLFNDRNLKAPSLFEVWYDRFVYLLWDEMRDSTMVLRTPAHETTIDFMLNRRDSPFMDIVETPEKENLTQLVLLAMEDGFKKFNSLDEVPDWGHFKQTTIEHIARIEPFGRSIYCSGNKNIVNATGEKTGPSWRMVVHLTDPIEAWGIYPGGQSGNPGNPHYDDFIDDWTEGKYYPLLNTGDENYFKAQGFQTFHLNAPAE